MASSVLSSSSSSSSTSLSSSSSSSLVAPSSSSVVVPQPANGDVAADGGGAERAPAGGLVNGGAGQADGGNPEAAAVDRGGSGDPGSDGNNISVILESLASSLGAVEGGAGPGLGLGGSAVVGGVGGVRGVGVVGVVGGVVGGVGSGGAGENKWGDVVELQSQRSSRSGKARFSWAQRTEEWKAAIAKGKESTDSGHASGEAEDKGEEKSGRSVNSKPTPPLSVDFWCAHYDESSSSYLQSAGRDQVERTAAVQRLHPTADVRISMVPLAGGRVVRRFHCLFVDRKAFDVAMAQRHVNGLHLRACVRTEAGSASCGAPGCAHDAQYQFESPTGDPRVDATTIKQAILAQLPPSDRKELIIDSVIVNIKGRSNLVMVRGHGEKDARLIKKAGPIVAWGSRASPQFPFRGETCSFCNGRHGFDKCAVRKGRMLRFAFSKRVTPSRVTAFLQALPTDVRLRIVQAYPGMRFLSQSPSYLLHVFCAGESVRQLEANQQDVINHVYQACGSELVAPPIDLLGSDQWKCAQCGDRGHKEEVCPLIQPNMNEGDCRAHLRRTMYAEYNVSTAVRSEVIPGYSVDEERKIRLEIASQQRGWCKQWVECGFRCSFNNQFKRPCRYYHPSEEELHGLRHSAKGKQLAVQMFGPAVVTDWTDHSGDQLAAMQLVAEPLVLLSESESAALQRTIQKPPPPQRPRPVVPPQGPLPSSSLSLQPSSPRAKGAFGKVVGVGDPSIRPLWSNVAAGNARMGAADLQVVDEAGVDDGPEGDVEDGEDGHPEQEEERGGDDDLGGEDEEQESIDADLDSFFMQDEPVSEEKKVERVEVKRVEAKGQASAVPVKRAAQKADRTAKSRVRESEERNERDEKDDGSDDRRGDEGDGEGDFVPSQPQRSSSSSSSSRRHVCT